jgi:hypothetical protein
LYVSEETIFALIDSSEHVPQVASINVVSGATHVINALPVNLETERLERIYWSPMGEQLAYQTLSIQQSRHQVSLDPEQLNLYLFDVENNIARLLTDGSNDNCVAWTSDEQYLGIVTARWREESTGLLQSNGLTVLGVENDSTAMRHPQYQNHQLSFGCPFAWSQDNSELAFQGHFQDIFGQVSAGLFIVADDGDNANLVANMPNIIDIQWSADGTYLAVDTLYNDGGDIRVVSRDGWEQIYSPENGGLPLANPRWQP